MTRLQTTGTYDGKSGDFSISICPNDNHLFTLDGLSVDDMKELKSLVDILLDSYEDEKTREYNLREAEYYNKRAQLDMNYQEAVSTGYEMTADGFWTPPQKEDKVVHWKLPVEVDGPSGECYVIFPDDLLDAANLREGDYVEWISNDDGSYTMKKMSKTLSMEEC